MENQKNLQVAILKEIGQKIAPDGFKQKMSHHSFYRKTDFGKQAFHISFVRHKDDIDMIADVGIRFDALEDFVHRYLDKGFMSERDLKYTFSFGSELGRLLDKGQMRWTIITKSDVEREAQSILKMFETVGLPYLERYSSMCDVFATISVINREAALLNAVPAKQARNALSLAYLCNKDRETIERVTRQMTDFLTPIPNSGVAEFRRFAEAVSRSFN